MINRYLVFQISAGYEGAVVFIPFSPSLRSRLKDRVATLDRLRTSEPGLEWLVYSDMCEVYDGSASLDAWVEDEGLFETWGTEGWDVIEGDLPLDLNPLSVSGADLRIGRGGYFWWSVLLKHSESSEESPTFRIGEAPFG
jgi:hypothetical protein